MKVCVMTSSDACRGQCICVVGEWHGDTAEPSFFAALESAFALAQRVPLPNWTDSAHELTIWERRPASQDREQFISGAQPESVLSTEEEGTIAIVACSVCGTTSGPLRRCRYCRESMYCSAVCIGADSTRHAEVHAMRLVFFAHRQLSYDSPVDFEALLS